MGSAWRIGLAVLAIIDGIFHFLLKGSGPLSTTGIYFLLSGVLLIVGALLVLVKDTGVVFAIGAYGLIAIAAIDNALLYLTRTYGLRFLSSVMGGSGGRGPPGGNFTRQEIFPEEVILLGRLVSTELSRGDSDVEFLGRQVRFHRALFRLLFCRR